MTVRLRYVGAAPKEVWTDGPGMGRGRVLKPGEEFEVPDLTLELDPASARSNLVPRLGRDPTDDEVAAEIAKSRTTLAADLLRREDEFEPADKPKKAGGRPAKTEP
jgi:hypothetical protein